VAAVWRLKMHTLLTVIYTVLTDGTPYRELGTDYLAR
jgi:hypothetical protein